MKAITVFVEEFSRESVECPVCGESHEREWPDIIFCVCGQEIAVDLFEEGAT